MTVGCQACEALFELADAVLRAGGPVRWWASAAADGTWDRILQAVQANADLSGRID